MREQLLRIDSRLLTGIQERRRHLIGIQWLRIVSGGVKEQALLTSKWVEAIHFGSQHGVEEEADEA